MFLSSSLWMFLRLYLLLWLLLARYWLCLFLCSVHTCCVLLLCVWFCSFLLPFRVYVRLQMHCGSAIVPGAWRSPHHCAPLECVTVSKFQGGLACGDLTEYIGNREENGASFVCFWEKTFSLNLIVDIPRMQGSVQLEGSGKFLRSDNHWSSYSALAFDFVVSMYVVLCALCSIITTYPSWTCLSLDVHILITRNWHPRPGVSSFGCFNLRTQQEEVPTKRQ